jgi:hypothetical protein
MMDMDKVKVLFLSANPAGTTKLQLDEEIRQIMTKIRASEYRDALELVPRFATRPDDFLQALLEHMPHIVHFSGHGSSTEELIVLDEHGRPKPISKEALVSLFRALKDNVRVVLLNACYTRPQAEAISATIDCTIGMNKPIGDEAAIVFVASFYRALGFGRSVQDAFEMGKVALLLEGIPEESTPALWSREGADASKIILIRPPQRGEGSQAKTSSVDSLPTLILSHFVPNEESGRGQLHYRDASLSRSGTDQLRYRSHIEARHLVIEPDDPYLDMVRAGGEIRPLDFWYSPWARTFTFPALDIKLINNTGKTIFFHEAILRVRKSKLNPRPVPVIDGTGYQMTLPLINIGWGPMEDCVLRFALLNPHEKDAHESKPVEKSRYPFELKLGDIDVAPDALSLDPYFESAGVDVKMLRKLWQHRYADGYGVYFDEDGELGEQFDDSDLDLPSYVRPHVNEGRPLTRRMPWSGYWLLENQSLGTFPDREALIVGELEYGQSDSEGNKSRRTNKLTAVVILGEEPEGAPQPPSYSYQIRLEVEGEQYTRTIPISQSLRARKTDRFLIFVAAEKSSVHEFDLVLRYNESEQLESRPVKLELFLSRLDARYVGEMERDFTGKKTYSSLHLNAIDDSQQRRGRQRDRASIVAPPLRRFSASAALELVKSVITSIRKRL